MGKVFLCHLLMLVGCSHLVQSNIGSRNSPAVATGSNLLGLSTDFTDVSCSLNALNSPYSVPSLGMHSTDTPEQLVRTAQDAAGKAMRNMYSLVKTLDDMVHLNVNSLVAASNIYHHVALRMAGRAANYVDTARNATAQLASRHGASSSVRIHAAKAILAARITVVTACLIIAFAIERRALLYATRNADRFNRNAVDITADPTYLSDGRAQHVLADARADAAAEDATKVAEATRTASDLAIQAGATLTPAIAHAAKAAADRAKAAAAKANYIAYVIALHHGSQADYNIKIACADYAAIAIAYANTTSNNTNATATNALAYTKIRADHHKDIADYQLFETVRTAHLARSIYSPLSLKFTSPKYPFTTMATFL